MGKPKIKKTKFYCYKITCLVNAKAYVGICSTSIIKRWTQHKHDAKNGAKTPLHSAIRKYGDKTFSIELLALVNNWEDVCRLECEYIVKYNTLAKNKNGYNVSIGGEGPFGVERSIETKKKLSEITKKWLKNDPSRLENLRKKAKKQMEDPINREKSRKGALKQWENEEFRKKFIQHKIEWVKEKLVNVSERRICRVVGQMRSTQRYKCSVKDDEAVLIEDMIKLVLQYGRYGYRRIASMLRQDGWWRLNNKRVERLWRREGLKVPQKQPKRKRLWLNDGSCIRLRPKYRNHVWSYDFVHDRTSNGRKVRMLTIIDEYSRESLAIEVGRKLNSHNVIEVLSQLFVEKGIPEHIRSDNGPEFIAKRVRGWLKRFNVKTLFIEPGSPWENGYIESFNGKLRDELLDREIFDTLYETKVLVERWRWEYNTIRPHSSLGYRPPAPEAIKPRWVEKSPSLSHNYWYN